MKRLALLALMWGPILSAASVDPDHIGGFYGTHNGSWYTATGNQTTAPDGTPAFEYTSPWDPYPVWANLIVDIQPWSPAPPQGLYLPTLPTPSDWFVWYSPDNGIVVWPETDPPTETPEPGTLAGGLIALLLIVSVHYVRREA